MKTTLALLAVMLSTTACGGGDESSGTTSEGGGTSTGGQGAVTSSGGSEPGVASGGQGTPASGGGNSEDPRDAGHCGDLTSYDAFGLYPYYMENCDDDSSGLDLSSSLNPWVKSIILEQPLAPGDTWAFSTLVGGGGPFELYGAKELCGEALELLDSTSESLGEEEGVVCLEAAPQQDTYTHLVWVWHSGSRHSETALCPGGMCPAP